MFHCYIECYTVMIFYYSIWCSTSSAAAIAFNSSFCSWIWKKKNHFFLYGFEKNFFYITKSKTHVLLLNGKERRQRAGKEWYAFPSPFYYVVFFGKFNKRLTWIGWSKNLHYEWKVELFVANELLKLKKLLKWWDLMENCHIHSLVEVVTVSESQMMKVRLVHVMWHVKSFTNKSLQHWILTGHALLSYRFVYVMENRL